MSVNERENLWEEVRQGITYQNISVRSRIASELVAPEEKPYATNAARQKTERLRVDLHQVRGTGVDGRISLFLRDGRRLLLEISHPPLSRITSLLLLLFVSFSLP
jgi:pyruvate/2-oxoglutarate dehydrogenase complex dihydrolipoamide acyltransferase (E2) component